MQQKGNYERMESVSESRKVEFYPKDYERDGGDDDDDGRKQKNRSGKA